MYYRRKNLLLLLLIVNSSIASPLWAQTGGQGTEQVQEEYRDTETDTIFTEEAIEHGEEAAYEEDAYTDEYASGKEAAAQPILFSRLLPPLQQKERNITPAQWRRLTGDPEFTYVDEEVKTPQQQGDSAWLRFFEAIFGFLRSGGGKAIIITLVSLLVLYLIFRIFQMKGNIFFAKSDKKLGTAGGDELSDDFVPDSWDKVIDDAVKAGNYRLAVRHSYRYLLSLLQEREVIQYQVAKTNYQYAYELSGTKLHRPFLQLTRGYEYVWYGGFPIAKPAFEAYYQQITQIRKELP